MTITITIDDDAAPGILQNIAAAKGWTDLTNDEIKAKVGADLAEEIAELAVRGDAVRRDAEAKAAAKAVVDGSLTVT